MAGWRVRSGGAGGGSGEASGVVVNIEPLDYAKLADAIASGLIAALTSCGQCNSVPTPEPEDVLCRVTTEAGITVVNNAGDTVVRGCCSAVVDYAGVGIVNESGELVYAGVCGVSPRNIITQAGTLVSNIDGAYVVTGV